MQAQFQRPVIQSSSSCVCAASTRTPIVLRRRPAQPHSRLLARAEISPQTGESTPPQDKGVEKAPGASPAQSPQEEAQSRAEAQTIGELKRQQLQGQSQTNILQGALEEAQLITWPTAKKAFSDTILVLAIVTATGGLLFGVNVLLAEGSQWWYHR